jgi:nickel/cobalt transporter (NicO) family protein
VTHAHGPGGHPHRHLPHGTVTLRELFALGISGGIVPCPAALVVLLAAVSLQRIAFGLLLIVAFSVGLAAVLVAIGLLVVWAGRLMAMVGADGPLITRWLPLASSAVITLFGLGIAVQALVAAGIVQIRL